MRKKLLRPFSYFSAGEIILWSISTLSITISFFIFDRENYLILAASLIGASSLILSAKGNPAGQVFMILFSIIYGFISFKFSYYGETITYVDMTMPMAVLSLISWLKNPYEGSRYQVKINRLKRREIPLMIFITAIVTFTFYYILKIFHTANLIPSAASVATSFLAVYLSFRRSIFFAAAYAANDIILIILWSIAAKTEISYLSVVICFFAFLINDIYGLFNWRSMRIRQERPQENLENA